MKSILIWLLGAALAVTGAALVPVAAQEKPKEKQKPAKKVYVDPAWKPMTVSATAMRFGAELEENASEELKRWVKEQVKQQLRNRPVEPKTAMALADARFAATASEEACDAVTYLLYYVASHDEDENQRLLAARIRDIDRETIEITRQMQVMWKNEQARSASPNQPMSQEQRVAQEEGIQRMEAQLREYAQERQFKGTELNASRKKLNAYLKLLTVVHPRMEGIEPSVVRGMQ